MYVYAYVCVVRVKAYIYLYLVCLRSTRYFPEGKNMSSFCAMNLPLELHMEEH